MAREPTGPFDAAEQQSTATMFSDLEMARVLLFKSRGHTDLGIECDTLWVVDRIRFTVPGDDVSGYAPEETGIQVVSDGSAQMLFTAPKPSLGQRPRRLSSRR